MQRKRVIFHVGLPKTGTTTIQNFLAANTAALEEVGVLFPTPESPSRAALRQTGVGQGHHTALLQAAQGRWDELGPGEWDEWQAEFRRFRDSDALTTLVLSHESFGHNSALDLTVLADALDGHDLTILIAMREADAWLGSYWGQSVTGPKRASVTPANFPLALNYVRGGFKRRINTLRRRFPGAAIQLTAFETLIHGDGLLVNALRALGISGPLLERARAIRRSNATMSPERLEILRRCNASGVSRPDFNLMRRALLKSNRSEGKSRNKGSLFPAELGSAIADRYDADVRWVRNRFAVELPPAARPKELVLSSESISEIADRSAHFLDERTGALLRAATQQSGEEQ